MFLSITDSIQQLKKEVISADWQLSPKRAELLDAAFTCLKQRFKTRTALLAIITMASNALEYIRSHGSQTTAIDFLKEAMAQVVTIYENETFVPEEEKKIFEILYNRFLHLKQTVHKEKFPPSIATPPSVNEKKESCQTMQPPVEKAESILQTLQQLLAEADIKIGNLKELLKVKDAVAPSVSIVEKKVDREKKLFIESVINTNFLQLVIGERGFAFPESYVAHIGSIQPKKRHIYIKEGQVPLKDFKRFLRNLPSEFTGPLALIPQKKLKKLFLPLMIPQGLDLPILPDDNAAAILVLSNGNRHGAILGSAVHREPLTITRFNESRNGDIVGIVCLEDKTQIPLVNVPVIIEREGFFFI